MAKTAKPAPMSSTKENSKELDDDEKRETNELYTVPAILGDRMSNQPLNASNQATAAIIGVVDDDEKISEEPKERGGPTEVTTNALSSGNAHTNTLSPSGGTTFSTNPLNSFLSEVFVHN